jgi:hypothetical protein
MISPILFTGSSTKKTGPTSKKISAPKGPPVRTSPSESATSVAQRQLLSYHQLKQLLLEDEHPYLGHIPDEFKKSAKADSAELKAGLDWLAEMTQSPEGLKQLKPSRLKSIFGKKSSDANPLEKLVAKSQLKVNPLGGGIAGNVFQLQVKGQDYALKVFKERDSMDAYRESATGLFFTARETQNMAKLYASSPTQPQRRWALMEFIPKDVAVEDRAGTRYSAQGAKLSDNKPENCVPQNNKKGVRVDLGGIVQIEGEGYMASDEFKYFPRQKKPEVIITRPASLATSLDDWASVEAKFDEIYQNSKDEGYTATDTSNSPPLEDHITLTHRQKGKQPETQDRKPNLNKALPPIPPANRNPHNRNNTLDQIIVLYEDSE